MSSAARSTWWSRRAAPPKSAAWANPALRGPSGWLREALIATQPELERKGASSPYTSVNGNMFTVLSSDGTLGIRLAQADGDAFMQRYGTGLYEAHGTVMREVG